MRQQLSNAITQAVAYLRLFGPHSEEYKQAYNSVQEAKAKIKRARREGRVSNGNR